MASTDRPRGIDGTQFRCSGFGRVGETSSMSGNIVASVPVVQVVGQDYTLLLFANIMTTFERRKEETGPVRGHH